MGDIVEALDIAQPSVSKHLVVLRETALVTVRREGKHMYYRTNPETLRTIHQWSGMFEKYWQDQLRRIKTHAEAKHS